MSNSACVCSLVSVDADADAADADVDVDSMAAGCLHMNDVLSAYLAISTKQPSMPLIVVTKKR